MDDYFRYMYNGKEADERLMNSRYEEGIEDGVIKEKNEIAKEMLKKDMDINLISELTGLSIDEIEMLNK